MNEDRAQRVRRWLLPVWVAYCIAWLVALAVMLTVFGGFSSPGQAVPIVLSGIAGVLGLFTGWQGRREDRANR